MAPPDIICPYGCPPGPACAYTHVAARVPKGSEGDKSNRLCPAHDDRKASLSFNPGNRHRTVWHCGAECDPAEIRVLLLADYDIDPICLGDYANPDNKPRRIAPGMRVNGYDAAMVSAAKRWYAVDKLPHELNGKLLRMCIQAIGEGDGDLPGDPLRLLPVNQDDFLALAQRAGIQRTYRYKLYVQWVKS